jgi:hypothetical protein
MTRLQEAISLGLVLGVIHGLVQPAYSVPVVPNFTQGSMTSHTETTSTVTETINSIDYSTGWQYTVTGTNVNYSGSTLSPSANTNSVTVNPLGGISGSVTSSTSSLDLSTRGNYTIATPGASFQFTETYQGPGMTNQTIIQRTTEIRSVTDTTSVFTE